jgi:threonine dehydrogenase-like Zn-dependent dehydrogenase
MSEPVVRPGSLIVAIDRCAVGGSDFLAFTTNELPAPAWFGHAWSGRVVEVGPGVDNHFAGERVVGAAPPPCGQCGHCVAGFPENCDLVLEMIVGTDVLASDHGAFAERIRVDHRRVRRTPEGLDDNDAALAEPAAVAAHALARSGTGIGDLVVVIGAGTIGLLIAELARIAGAARVVVIDPHVPRRELACDLGSDAAFAGVGDVAGWLERHGHGLGADVVFDCLGAAGGLSDAVDLARHGGTVVAVGIRSSDSRDVPADLVKHEITIRASLGYTTADVQRVLDLLAEDRLRVGPLIDTEVRGLNDLQGVLAAEGERSERAILISPSL